MFIHTKLLIHFGEDKTKSKLFSKTKRLKEINISFAGYSIKQDDAVQHLRCNLHSKLSGEVMTSIALRKVNAKLKFLYWQSRYLTPSIRTLLYNGLIQPQFDYGCSSWSPLLKKKLKIKLPKDQNKYIPFGLLPRSRIDRSHFRKIKWLPASDRVEHCSTNIPALLWNV